MGTTLLIIGIGTVIIIMMANKLQKALPDVTKFKAQVAFMNEYVKYIQDPNNQTWISECSSNEEAIEVGQDKLWDATRTFCHAFTRMQKNSWTIQLDDPKIIDSTMAILCIVHAMNNAAEGKLNFPTEEENEAGEDNNSSS